MFHELVILFFEVIGLKMYVVNPDGIIPFDDIRPKAEVGFALFKKQGSFVYDGVSGKGSDAPVVDFARCQSVLDASVR